jgi:hypothetical protein
MSEATLETTDASQMAANEAAARAIDRARVKQIGQLHFAMGMGALTLWGAADAWSSVSGLAIAWLASIANALIAGFVVTSILHEWGHFAAARLAGAVSPALEKPRNHFFIFDFSFEKNDTRQFVWMSWGGILVPWALVLAVLLLVPLDDAGRIVLFATFVARAVAISLFEVPVVRGAMAGGDPRSELGRRLPALKKSFATGNAVGVAVAALVWLAI